MGTLSAYIDGVGFLGPGLTGWPAAAQVLAGHAPWTAAPTVLPIATQLPPAERRRTGTLVRLTLATGLEATTRAQVEPRSLPVVFASSGGDGETCHAICETLASGAPELSPTRFHNSVHNAAAGYWGIATGALTPANALCAGDASFAAGLIEAMCQLAIERRPVLLIAYDASYPEPLHSVRPIPFACAVALVLAPQASGRTQARIAAHLAGERASPVREPALEALRGAIPAARALPLLERLAVREAGRVVLDYLADLRLALEVSPCR